MHSIHLPHNHSNNAHKIAGLLPGNKEFQTASSLFRLLGDESRMRIFWILCHCEECVANISAMVEMTSPAVSHHLKLLKASGLVESRRDGKEVYYRSADTNQAQTLHKMLEELIEISCPS